MPESLQKSIKKSVKKLERAMKDGEISKRELEQINRKSKAVKDFLEGKEKYAAEKFVEAQTPPHKRPDDYELREASLMEAVNEVADQHPELNAENIYAILFPYEYMQVFAPKSEDFWNDFENIYSNQHRILVKLRTLHEATGKREYGDNNGVLNFMNNMNKIPNEFFDRNFVSEIIENCPIRRMFTAYSFKKWKSKDFAMEMLIKLIKTPGKISERGDMGNIDAVYKQAKHQDYGEEFFTFLAESGADIYNFCNDMPYGDKILKIELEKALEDRKSEINGEKLNIFDRKPEDLLKKYYLFYKEPYAETLLEGIKGMMPKNEFEKALEWAKRRVVYYEKGSIKERSSYLKSLVEKINPEFESELAKFNSKNQLSLSLMGLSENNCFVLINTWMNTEDKFLLPIRLELTEDELKKGKLNQNLHQKLEDEFNGKKDQIELWKRKRFDYDLPKNGNTSFMTTTVPDDLIGMETDAIRIANVFQEKYEAKWEAVLVEDISEWERVEARAGNNHPEAKEATRENVLSSFESGLKKAIDESKTCFLFYYTMHGSNFANGRMQAADWEGIDAAEFAQVLAKEYKGRPIAAQIEVVIFSESCFSGSQQERIIDELKDKKVPTKSLRIITTSSESTPSAVAYDRYNLSLIGNKMLEDGVAISSYYISYYFEMIDYLKSEGKVIEPPLGTMGHAVVFADRMASDDSGSYKQDLKAYYHSTEDPEMESGLFSKLESMQKYDDLSSKKAELKEYQSKVA